VHVGLICTGVKVMDTTSHLPDLHHHRHHAALDTTIYHVTIFAPRKHLLSLIIIACMVRSLLVSPRQKKKEKSAAISFFLHIIEAEAPFLPKFKAQILEATNRTGSYNHLYSSARAYRLGA
jgi:hypothetical protein